MNKEKRQTQCVLVGWVLYMLRQTLECSDGESLRVNRLGVGTDRQSQCMRVVDLAKTWCVQKRWIQSTEYGERWNESVSVWTQCGNLSAAGQGVYFVNNQVLCVLGKGMYQFLFFLIIGTRYLTSSCPHSCSLWIKEYLVSCQWRYSGRSRQLAGLIACRWESRVWGHWCFPCTIIFI